LRLSPEVEAVLTAYRWPGNVRELRNAIERAAVLVQGDLITPQYLPDALFQDAPATPAAGSHAASLEEVEREQIVRVLAESPTLEDAAETLGINVSTLWRKRRRYKIE
jgi:NtrC-family two-component system response regulator AlgB